MINLGHPGLNQLPEATKNRISEIIAYYFHSPARLKVASNILMSFYVEELDSTLVQLEEWQYICQISPTKAQSLINDQNSKLQLNATSCQTNSNLNPCHA